MRISPQFKTVVWGNPELNKKFNLDLKDPVGEVWLLSGTEPFVSMVNNLDINVFWNSLYPNQNKFPILLKLISTKQWLSVQVHPDDELALELEGQPNGKTEAWYFLEDGQIAILEDSSKLKYLIKEKDTKLWEKELTFLKVKTGTFVYLPAGVVHALGADSTVLEIQQASNITYRIYDWGRDRETHIEKALKCAKSFKLSELVFHSKTLETPYFKIEIIDNAVLQNIPAVSVLIKKDCEIAAKLHFEPVTLKNSLVVTNFLTNNEA